MRFRFGTAASQRAALTAQWTLAVLLLFMRLIIMFGAAKTAKISGALEFPMSNVGLAQHAPKVSFEQVWHVGTLDADDKGRQYRDSYEGAGLSVSQHPQEWASIARLGGQLTWELTKSDNVFLDYHQLTEIQKSIISEWGIEQGFVVSTEVWRVSWWDDELDDTVSFVLPSYEQALEEVHDTLPESEMCLVATDSFPDPTVIAGSIDPHQILATLWVEVFCPELDGVHWEDTFDPQAYSCPRAVILVSKVKSWSTKVCQ